MSPREKSPTTCSIGPLPEATAQAPTFELHVQRLLTKPFGTGLRRTVPLVLDELLVLAVMS